MTVVFSIPFLNMSPYFVDGEEQAGLEALAFSIGGLLRIRIYSKPSTFRTAVFDSESVRLARFFISLQSFCWVFVCWVLSGENILVINMSLFKYYRLKLCKRVPTCLILDLSCFITVLIFPSKAYVFRIIFSLLPTGCRLLMFLS